MTNRKIEYWVIPPEADAEFAASMEEVLDVYARPYDSRHPVLCMDEQPIQLLKETRQPVAGTKKHPRRVDYEYERSLGLDTRPAWSPNGRRLAFTSNRDGRYQIYTMNADGSGQRRVRDHAGRDDYAAWHPDGQHLLVVSEQGGRSDLYLLEAPV